MPSWTISAPEDFQKLVKETAPKLGEGYSEFIQKAVRERVKRLTGEDFEEAKKRVEFLEKKRMLSTIRERERIWLREKGHKKKNIERVKEDLGDPELQEEFLKLIEPREQIADEVLRLHEELNPISVEFEKPPKFKNKKEKLAWYKQKMKQLKELELSRNLSRISARWDDFEEGWMCNLGGGKDCEYVFDPPYIFVHLQEEHGISPEQATFEGGSGRKRVLWKSYVKPLQKKYNLDDEQMQYCMNYAYENDITFEQACKRYKRNKLGG